MKEVVEFLKANPVQYLATVGRDGKAKCRPFMFYLDNAKATIADFSGNPPREYSC